MPFSFSFSSFPCFSCNAKRRLLKKQGAIKKQARHSPGFERVNVYNNNSPWALPLLRGLKIKVPSVTSLFLDAVLRGGDKNKNKEK